MPWEIIRKGSQHCVVKQGTTAPVNGGCHARRADAVRQLRALYAKEPQVAAAISEEETMTFPLKPPAAWFETPEPDGPEPLTVEADGRVHGHLALWNQCHTGYVNGSLGECLRPPRSELANFHVGALETEDGAQVPVGKIVYDTKHAALSAGALAASRHYDDNGQVGAYVRARNGQHGIYLSGALRSDISPEGLQTLRANPPSGDWRAVSPGSGLELIAALAVPVPGYPIPRQMAVAASGEVATLILPGYCEECDEEEVSPMAEETTDRDRSYIRKRSMIASSLTDGSLSSEEEIALSADEVEGLTAAADFSAADRRRMAKAGIAMPDGSFPIPDCAYYMKARRAIGRAPEGKRARVMAHIARRGKALGCKAPE